MLTIKLKSKFTLELTLGTCYLQVGKRDWWLSLINHNAGVTKA